METSKLRKFAQFARHTLRDQVEGRLKLVLSVASIERRESPDAVTELEKQIKAHGKEQVIEQVAYIWFNRFCALRFMDVNRYNRIGVLSPQPGQFQPEILAEAKAGHIDDSIVSKEVAKKVFALLDGTVQMEDAQNEAYRLLIVAVSNHWNQAMPFLFEKISDYTELLMPEDLLSNNSILAYTREALTPDICGATGNTDNSKLQTSNSAATGGVEVIGWLYQFYISEKKDEVFEGLKKKKKITAENIPAATQLFTPHYIVRYLVENSLGRLWMLNRPNSRLIDRMEYYIAPDNQQPSTDYLRVSSPEEIRICDPACGSGHMLTYAFDLLYAIYEEEGYEPNEIPEKILTQNLYGIEIDERAGELAAFALAMKARSKQRRFFSRSTTRGEPVEPNIKVLEKVVFDEGELAGYMDEIGSDLFTAPLLATLKQFDEVDNFGSLIIPKATDVAELKRLLDEKDMRGNLLLHGTHQKVLQALEMADYLGPKYHVVIANPPYMGAKSMTARLKTWANQSYPCSKYDLYSMFIDRNLNLVRRSGLVSMITMQSWMFLSSYENLRELILKKSAITSMLHLGTRAFDSIGGEVVSTTAFVLQHSAEVSTQGVFVDLREGGSEQDKESLLFGDSGRLKYRASSLDFEKIPCAPIAYWVNESVLKAFSSGYSFSDVALPKQGLSTCNNDLFLRLWHEVPIGEVGFASKDRNEARTSNKRWFPYNKGGTYRKWFGNNEYLVNWYKDGKDIHEYSNLPLDYNGAPVRGKNYYFKLGMTWSSLAGAFSGRLSPYGHAFDAKGPVLFSIDSNYSIEFLMCCLNSKAAFVFLKILAPTLDFNQGPIGRMPLPNSRPDVRSLALRMIDLERADWDESETSWGFETQPLLNQADHSQILENTYTVLSEHWDSTVEELQHLEEENNQIFAEAYSLDLKPDVPIDEITLLCNPPYRYGGNKSEEELEALLLADTMKDFISYAVGCMFGRYSLDKPGLILANTGETLEDYLTKVNMPLEALRFEPDDDNVIPILEGDWFTDDIAERFRKFLRITFGDEHYEENLRFIEEAIGKPVEKYFRKDFYTDHVKRYKKRPIYWLFSSPAGSFNALIYMHRYRPDTVSVVLNDYLREFREKLTARLDHQESITVSGSSTQGEKTKATKEITKLKKALDDVNAYENEILYPLATKQISIDLDDGVKHNYPLFGKALKKVTGLSAK